MTFLSRRAQYAEGAPIINTLMARALDRPELISLAAGFVDQATLPVEEVAAASDAVFSHPVRARQALQYGTTIGHRPLRETIVERHAAADRTTPAQIALSPDRVVLTAGSNQALHLVGEVLLDPGDVVLCAAPSYFVYLGTIRNFGARPVGVEIDERGMLPEAIDDTLKGLDRRGEIGRVKAIYVTTYSDNPTGVTTSAARRQAIVELTRRWTARLHRPLFVLEDTAYRELRYRGEDVPSLRSFDPTGEWVIATGSFSKSFSPGIRVGWGILPPSLLDAVLAHKGGIDFGSANLNQVLMHEIIASGRFDKHAACLRRGYGVKLAAAIAAIERHLSPLGVRIWGRPTGGLYVWIVLPEQVETGLSGRLFDTAVQKGVLYVPGEYCYPPEGSAIPKNRIRLSFGVPPVEAVERGVELLGAAIRDVLERNA